ncbi:putative o-succinylbenzoate-CoA ligase, menE [Chlamydiales bacterium STE3]|nr:putative o-succinylbenzoate-CoA ligase, menE [Chlamydiales bacterium STE3]
MIPWEDEQPIFFFNPRFSNEQKEKFCGFFSQLTHIKNHLILSTSGSQAQKWVALSKTALLSSAKNVNAFLSSDASDIWIKALPNHHVGGLSIYARSFLSGAKVNEYTNKWDPFKFVEQVVSEHGTLSSLVPTQLYDLLKMNLKSPSSLRAVIIGGGALPPHLYNKAKELGWPVLPSYGLTECCSQVATATLETPSLMLLPHVEAKISQEGCLMIKSPALLSGYITTDKGQPYWIDPKINGWLTTEDLANIEVDKLIILDRKDGQFKIAGEMVSLKNLEAVLDKICFELNVSDAAIVPLPDKRLGYIICLVIQEKNPLIQDAIKAAFKAQVLPYEQIRVVKVLDGIPRTSLGKVRRAKLVELCLS